MSRARPARFRSRLRWRVAWRARRREEGACVCQADKSAVATVSKTKELKKRYGYGVGQERVITPVLEVICPTSEAALLSACFPSPECSGSTLTIRPYRILDLRPGNEWWCGCVYRPALHSRSVGTLGVARHLLHTLAAQVGVLQSDALHLARTRQHRSGGFESTS